MLEAERDIGFEKTELVAAIEASPRGAQPVERLAVGDQRGEPVGELDLVAAAGLHVFEMPEHLGLDDVAADDRQVRWGLFRRGLFDDALGAHQAALVLDDVEHAVAALLLRGHLPHGQANYTRPPYDV